MNESNQVRTYQMNELNKILRDRRKLEPTISKTQIIDELIKKEVKRRGLK